MIDDTARLTALLRSSALFAMLDRVRHRLVTAFERSEVAAAWHRSDRQWRSRSAHERRRAVGVTVLVAAAVAVLLGWSSGTMVGPYWLIIPSIAAVVGVLSLVVARELSRQR